MSAPNEQARTAVPVSVGRILPDGRRIYRLATPQIVWWTWVALAAFSLGDLLIQGHNYLSVKFAFGLLTVTGVVYTSTLWPRVVADDHGMTVQNPLRKFFIPWGAVRGIFLADSVEVQCARGPQKKDKTVYSWALSSARRGRAKARLRGRQWEQGKQNRPSGYGQLPRQARELAKMSQAEVMARELAKMSDEANAKRDAGGAGHDDDASFGEAIVSDLSRDGVSANGTGLANGSDAAGAVGDVVTSTWAWPALAAILVPGIAFAIAMLVG